MNKIRLNALQYLLGLALTKAFVEPFDGIAKTLGEIAALAGRNDVVGRISTAFEYRGVMFLMQDTWVIPETRRIAAVGADTTEILNGDLPIGDGKSCGQCTLTSFATNTLYSQLLWMLFAVTLCRLLLSVRISLSPTLLLLMHGIWMSFSITLCYLSFLFAIIFSIRTLALPGAFNILIAPTPVALLFFVWICLAITSADRAATLTTPGASLLFSPAKILSRVREPFTAFCAALKRNWFVDHDASLSSNLKMSSAGGEISRFSGISLADNSLFYRIARLAATIIFSARSNV